MKVAAAIVAIFVLLNACATVEQPAAAGSTSQSADGFRYPYNSPYW